MFRFVPISLFARALVLSLSLSLLHGMTHLFIYQQVQAKREPASACTDLQCRRVLLPPGKGDHRPGLLLLRRCGVRASHQHKLRRLLGMRAYEKRKI